MCIENSVHNFLNMFAVVANVFRFTTFTFYARRPSYHRYYSYQLDVCVCFFSLFGTNKQFECVRVDFFSTFFRFLRSGMRIIWMFAVVCRQLGVIWCKIITWWLYKIVSHIYFFFSINIFMYIYRFSFYYVATHIICWRYIFFCSFSFPFAFAMILCVSVCFPFLKPNRLTAPNIL